MALTIGRDRPATEAAIWPGQPYPLGAAYDGLGTNFSIFSEVAEKVELCLFDREGRETRVELPEVTGFCWHGYLPTVNPGQRYGFRVHGPWKPDEGLRCNPAKLLLDPYAKAIEGHVRWGQAVFPYELADPERQERPDASDSAASMPKSVVINPYFDWTEDRPPRRPWHESVIYEAHVKGLTMRHPDVPELLRGTYGALAHPAMLRYFTELGVTAVELLPVHQFVHDANLLERGLKNYWGYNSIGYFAPHNDYSSAGERGEQVAEFKGMVRSLHQAGIEVILDVVYNHTAEGNNLGPMLSFKGIDNRNYYRLVPDDQRYYMDYTGTGNTLNMRTPHALQLVMDSLRYWVLEMHVDGFRFDLASTLARGLHDVDRLSAFFDLIHQDPVISQVKLIAEPWDVGEGGYQVGNFPSLWSEWNGRYRDTVRDLWRGHPEALPDFANRLTGSSDLYETTGRRPYASVNFITAHDGFTLKDLVSFDHKHNEANGEDNRDGTDDNRSWNCGVEGPTDDEAVRELRARQQRNLLATLFLSQGVPMLLGGDEIGRTQQGNNNAYCQDNDISWFDWDHPDQALHTFVQDLIQLRADHPTFRRRRWFQGRAIHGSDARDIEWLTPEGEPMKEEDWNGGVVSALTVYLSGDTLVSRDSRGEPVGDQTFAVLINGRPEATAFTVPGAERGECWTSVFDTAHGDFAARPAILEPDTTLDLEGRSIVLLRRVD